MQHLERALDQQNSWWKYVLTIFLAFMGQVIAYALALYVVVAYQNRGDFSIGAFANPENYGVTPNMKLFVVLGSFVGIFIVLAGLFKRLHKRSLREVINGTNRIRWGRFFFGAGVWFVMTGIVFLISYLLDPGNFKLTFNASAFLPLLLISLLGIPLQASSEEVMFRGYLAQGFGAWTRNRWIVLVAPSLLFALMHAGNPEIAQFGFWSTMPSYFLFGLTFALVSILDDGIEIAMGAHSANNLFASVFVSFHSSVLETPAVFYQLRMNPLRDTLVLAITSTVFIVMLGKKYKWDYSVLKRRIAGNGVDTNLTGMPADQEPILMSSPGGE